MFAKTQSWGAQYFLSHAAADKRVYVDTIAHGLDRIHPGAAHALKLNVHTSLPG
jgi:hypothetical protein